MKIIGSLVEARQLEGPACIEEMFEAFGPEFKKRSQYQPGNNTISLENIEGHYEMVHQGDWIVRVSEKDFQRVRKDCFDAIRALVYAPIGFSDPQPSVKTASDTVSTDPRGFDEDPPASPKTKQKPGSSKKK